jgi:hypothetical protein
MIDVVSLDSELKDLAESSLVVKIDVEGFEMEVLAGSEVVVSRFRPVILGEFNPSWLQSRGIPLTAPYDWCQEHGYEVCYVTPGRRHFWNDARLSVGLTPPGSGRGDLLLIPRERSSLMS